jgi:hypothetical protein
MAGYSWYLGGPAVDESIPWLYSSAIISGASLFVLSFVYHSRKYHGLSSSQRFLLALFDLATYFCAVTLVLWGLILPILRPIDSPGFQLYLLDQQTLAISIYAGLFLCSLVVASRIALQFLLVRITGVTAIVPVAAPLAAAPNTEERKYMEEALSAIRSEIVLLREEVSSLGRVPPSGISMQFHSTARENNPEWSSIGEVEPMPIAVETSRLPAISPDPVKTSEIPVTVAYTDPSPPLLEYEPTADVRLPDSAKDNPWASVLSRRETKGPMPSVSAPPVATSAPVVVLPEKKMASPRRARKGGGKGSAKKSEPISETPAPEPEVNQPQMVVEAPAAIAQKSENE